MFRLSRMLKHAKKWADQGSKTEHRNYKSHPGFPHRDSRSRSHARNKNDQGPTHKI